MWLSGYYKPLPLSDVSERLQLGDTHPGGPQASSIMGAYAPAQHTRPCAPSSTKTLCSREMDTASMTLDLPLDVSAPPFSLWKVEVMVVMVFSQPDEINMFTAVKVL